MHVPSSVFFGNQQMEKSLANFSFGEMELSFDFCFGTMYVYLYICGG